MSLNRLSKLWYIHTTEYSSAIKRDALLPDTHDNLEGSPGHYAEWKKKAHLKRSRAIGFHLHDILKWQSYRDGKQTSGCQGLGMVGAVGMVIKGQRVGDLCGDETL